jgi:hypothetical protein
MDEGQESYLSNPTPNPTLGVVEITRLKMVGGAVPVGVGWNTKYSLYF